MKLKLTILLVCLLAFISCTGSYYPEVPLPPLQASYQAENNLYATLAANIASPFVYSSQYYLIVSSEPLPPDYALLSRPRLRAVVIFFQTSKRSIFKFTKEDIRLVRTINLADKQVVDITDWQDDPSWQSYIQEVTTHYLPKLRELIYPRPEGLLITHE